jgi:hypothetical protein
VREKENIEIKNSVHCMMKRIVLSGMVRKYAANWQVQGFDY